DMITKSMQREPNLTDAMTRAFMFADASVAAEVAEVGFYMDRSITRAIAQGAPADAQLSNDRVITAVWMSTLLPWLTRLGCAAASSPRSATGTGTGTGTPTRPDRSGHAHRRRPPGRAGDVRRPPQGPALRRPVVEQVRHLGRHLPAQPQERGLLLVVDLAED